MMFRRLLSISAAVMALHIVPMAAQAQLSIAGGRSFPTGNFADDAVSGWTGQLSLNFNVSALPVGLRVDAMYQDFRNVDRPVSLYARTGGEWFRQSGFVLNATKAIAVGELQPYALVGAGVLREWHGDYSYSGTNHYSLATNIGVGLELPIMGGAFFVEGRGQNLVGSKSLPMTRPAVNSSVKFQSFPILIGLKF